MKKLLNYLGCRSKQDLIYQFKNSDSEEIAELRMAFELIA